MCVCVCIFSKKERKKERKKEIELRQDNVGKKTENMKHLNLGQSEPEFYLFLKSYFVNPK